MLERIETCLSEAGVGPGELLVVGVSGGVDSMVLLDLLLRSRFASAVRVVHVNYGMRGEASDLDEALVLAFCEAKSVPCTIVPFANPQAEGDGFQAEARRFRYRAFEAALGGGGGGRIVLGHHADDQAEQVVIASLRAADPRALGAMSRVSHGGRRLRPLLGAGKAEIRAWAEAHGTPFREDGSNGDPKYLRNAVRLGVLPAMEAARPGASRRLVGLSARMRDWAALVDAALEGHPAMPVAGPPRGVFPLAGCTGDARDREVLQRWVAAWGLGAAVAGEIAKLGRAGAVWTGGGVRVVRERDHWLWTSEAMEEATWQLDREELDVAEFEAAGRTTGEAACWCDVETLKEPLSVRPWSAGDRMQPWGWPADRTAKVSDLLTQAKVPVADRATWPVVEDAEGAIVWVPRVRRSSLAAVGPGTRGVVRLGLARKNNKT